MQDIPDLPKIKSTDNPITEKIHPEKDGDNSGASAPNQGNAQQNSDQLPSSDLDS